jgi:hypothetical protein
MLLIAAAVSLAGCGGHTITKDDVIAQGDQICETAASSVRALSPPAGQSLGELARYYRQVTPIVEAEVTKLRALPRPARDRALLLEYLSAVGRSAGEYEALVHATRTGDRAALVAAAAALRGNPAPSLANRYGMTRCGGSVGTAAS